MHTGQLEDIKNRTKVMKRVAYGYRHIAHFFLKIRPPIPATGEEIG